jgi:hypothetical protein
VQIHDASVGSAEYQAAYRGVPLRWRRVLEG